MTNYLTCTRGELCFFSDDIRLGAEENLTNYTQRALSKRIGNQLMPNDVVAEAISKISPYPPPRSNAKIISSRNGREIHWRGPCPNRGRVAL